MSDESTDRIFPSWMTNKQHIVFNGNVILNSTKEAIDFSCCQLRSLVARKVQNGQKLVVGFDCEWEVSFSKRIHKKVALIQICTSEKDCYLFHLSKMNFMPESLTSLISSDSLLKVGANINSDLYRLHRDYNVRSDTIVTGIRASTIDLCEFANTKFSMKQKWSLSTLCEFFLNKQLTKSETERFSKWSSSNLTLLQIKYASTDAYASLLVYFKICEGKTNLVDERHNRHDGNICSTKIFPLPYVTKKAEMPPRSPFWKFCNIAGDELECHFCKKKWKCIITRFSSHILEECHAASTNEDVTRLKNQYKQKENNSVTSQASQSSVSSGSQVSDSETSGNQTNSSVIKKRKRERDNSIDSYVDRINPTEQLNLSKLFARGLFMAGVSFSVADNKDFRYLLKQLRPAFNPPSRKEIAGKLLDSEYDQVKTIVNKFLNEAEYCSIVIDGWTNINRKPIHNIIVCAPMPIFVSSVPCDERSQDANYIFDVLTPIIDKIGSHKVCSIVSDNEAKMKRVGVLVQNKFFHIFHTGCNAHLINLLAKDIAKCDSVQKILQVIKSVVDSVCKSPKLSNILEKAAESVRISFNEKSRKLKLYSPTRFFGITDMITAFLSNKRVLTICSTDPDFTLDSEITRIIRDATFWDKVEGIHDFFKPIAAAIGKIESDNSTIADIPTVWTKLFEQLTFTMMFRFLNSNESREIFEIISNRLIQAHSNDYFLLANLLHPTYKGKKLGSAFKRGCDHLGIYATSLGFTAENIVGIEKAFANYLVGEGMFDTQIMKSDHSLRNYWNLVSVYASTDGEKNLSKIALRLAIIPSSNCAVERSFSIQSYVHSKARNRLLNKTTDKLMYIRINRMIFDKIKDDDVIAEFVDSESDIECISDTEDVSFIDELIPSTTGIVATEVIGNAATSMLEYSQQIEPEDNMLFDS